MPVSNIKVVYNSDGSVTVTPSSWEGQSIYSDGTLTFVDNSTGLSGIVWHLRESETGSGIASFIQSVSEDSADTGTVTHTLAEAFPGQTLIGRYLASSSLSLSYTPMPIVAKTTNVGAPSSPTLADTISRTDVQLSWGAGSAGTNNDVEGYDVQYQDSADGVTWPSAVTASTGWTTASGSPVTAAKLSVSPPSTVGYYRRFRVRTRGSAGSDYYSGWVVSTNTLRRKWNAFSAWTDATLTARTSMIRAVHLTEMQTRVNTIRTFYGLAAYSFTAVTARSSKLGRWAALIQEIRTAIDGITTSHETWNTLEAGKPRIAHVTQIRRIIDSM